MTEPSGIKLSICIGTHNRAGLLAATLESIVCQATTQCEIVVSDNASTDNTEAVVAECGRGFAQLRYFKQDTNKGLDQNYDHAVNLASGEYCWLMTDDDLFRPNAVARVLEALHRNPSLLIVNKEYRDFSMSRVLQPSALAFDSDRSYPPAETDRLFTEVNQDLIMYIGGVVIKREIWLARERERYYDSLFIHVAVVFQERLPGEAVVISEPLISYRLGNTHSYAARMIEIIFDKWPSLAKSLAISETARRGIPRIEPWRHPGWLLLMRAWGYYSLVEYKRWISPRPNTVLGRLAAMFIAIIPGVVVNTLLVAYFSTRQDRGRWAQAMRQSPYYLCNWPVFRH